ncbi:MAG: ABC transporter permease [Oscillospiraceae bacterium]|nr:ABC transporter permease [Oscillospiraceae bacterium]
MKTLSFELRKQRRSGVLPLMLAVGVLGAVCELVCFAVRGDTLLALPLPPTDMLLTQLGGMTALLNMLGLTAAVCAVYAIEFSGGAARKMYTLPVSAPAVFFCKFVILAALFLAAVCLQYAALAALGAHYLPRGELDARALAVFAAYSFLASLPVLSLMLFAASRLENMWMTLGVGVAGFLSGMALTASGGAAALLHPFALMLHLAAALVAEAEAGVVAAAEAETLVFLFAGLWAAAKGYE